MRGTDLANSHELAMHWGETCQNDVIEGAVDVPEPSGIALAGLGLGLLALRRRSRNAA
ncbi:PEP-CTERM sorting domain-containing protein [Massilia sp. H-1]|nr:PEP-CTERM sorting domain-containing protein [Massilia sp. H-1]